MAKTLRPQRWLIAKESHSGDTLFPLAHSDGDGCGAHIATERAGSSILGIPVAPGAGPLSVRGRIGSRRFFPELEATANNIASVGWNEHGTSLGGGVDRTVKAVVSR